MSWQLFLFCLSLWFSLPYTFCSPLSHPVSTVFSLLCCYFSVLLAGYLYMSFTFSYCLSVCLSLPRLPPLATQSAQIPLVSEHLRAGGWGYRLHSTLSYFKSLDRHITQMKNLNETIAVLVLPLLIKPNWFCFTSGQCCLYLPFFKIKATPSVFDFWRCKIKAQTLFLVDFVSSLFHHSFIILSVDPLAVCVAIASRNEW